MKMFCNERVAVITVTQDMYQHTGSNEQETEGSCTSDKANRRR